MLANPIMIARWMILTGIAGLLIIAALASWFLRDQIFQTFQDPGEPFQTYTPPDGADYANASAWYATGNPESAEEPAVFFVHPTTYSGGSNWNAQLDKDTANRGVIGIALPNYAVPFARSGALYVPRYRQASLYAFMNNREDSVQARLFAYADVERAFDAFLVEAGEDRPILLAGIGQGGFHVLGLLLNRLADSPDLRARLVAAYIIEAPVPLDLFSGPLATIPPCETPEDVRCVHTYSYARPDESDRIRILTERSMSWTPTGELSFVEGRGLLCINPILGARTSEYATARQHRGGVAAEGLPPDTTPAPIPGQTGAQCADGILFVDEPRHRDLQRPHRLAEDFREPPFNLFYEDLRLDAARRTFALTSILQEERRWAPPLDMIEEVEEAPVVPIPDRREF
ncbi:DUF3089 domain-containing protein [Maricaulis sp.]|uniref:DUF3089 domain-containing protein n=1 Tax=Maricaulis sp. TaxID=1486257 RepID=UPI0025C2C346|nr:DUF3089 domain-containing protein [Maricaulis sp.]